MEKLIAAMIFASVVALAAPSVFERYEAAALSGKLEVIDPPAKVVDAAASPAPAPALVGRVAELRPDPDGHFRTDALLNGRPVRVIVDTGATLVALDETTARHLGASPSPGDWHYKVMTANGEAMAAKTRLARVSIGPIEITNVDAMVVRDGSLPISLLGMSFLSRLDGFAVENGRLVLRQ
ncbi:TIGR02281 family clan AA aspartic protease [Jiella sp. M17.18]|uniref:TIGR02281 family clan AA aspartic protease n=1 Tax=Jiella sp. M17.18 TaxID=3234247 RepID=UPI0034DE4690